MSDYQERVREWAVTCFGEHRANDLTIRADRLLEEVLELLQSVDYNRQRVQLLVDYVWSRPIGFLEQEVGGVCVTLAAFCSAHEVDQEYCGEIELARCIEKTERIRAKDAAKPEHSPLPQ